MRTPTPTEPIREALTLSVVRAWDREFTRPAENGVDVRQARSAVAEVVSALRANPAWAKTLGIGS